MSTTKYKVWVSIECITTHGDGDEDFEEASAFPVCLGTFETVEEADKAIQTLTGESSL